MTISLKKTSGSYLYPPETTTNLGQSKIVLIMLSGPQLSNQIIYSELNVGFMAIYFSQYLNQ